MCEVYFALTIPIPISLFTTIKKEILRLRGTDSAAAVISYEQSLYYTYSVLKQINY